MITANEFNKCSLAQFELFHKLGIIARLSRMHIPLSPGAERVGTFTDETPLQAQVNHGRWIVKCECGGAEKAWEECKFMCLSCLNSGHKHKYRAAIFPENRTKIERILVKRPLVNRNWTPGESIGQLQRENKEHKGELL